MRDKLKNIRFVRFGGLSPLKQEHYISDEENKSFHNPPVKKGNYAFPEHYIEYFLIGSTNEPKHISGKAEWVKVDGKKVVIEKNDFEYDRFNNTYIFNKEIINLLKLKNLKLKNVNVHLNDDDTYSLIHLKKPKIFEYKGEIWSHFINFVKPQDVIEIKGSWVKTTYEVYVNAFNANMHDLMKDVHKDYFTNYSNDLDLGFIFKFNNPYKRNAGFVSYVRDSLEVFIEKIK